MSGLMRVPFFDDEFLTSFLLRTARANGRRSLEGFCRDLGVEPKAISLGHEADLVDLARILGVPSEPLVSRAIRPEAGFFRYGGEAYPRRQLARGPVRFCPRCLSDDDLDACRMPGTRRYSRLVWAVRCIQTCARHGCRLLPLPTSRFSSNHGDLGHLSAAAPGQDFEIMSATAFERFASARITGSPEGDRFRLDLPLPVAIQLCEHVGLAAIVGRNYEIPEVGDAVHRDALERGFAILEKGEQSLEALFDELSATAITIVRPSGSQLYGALYRNIVRRPPLFEAIATALRSHAMRRYPALSPFTAFGRRRSEPMPMRDIAAATGLPEDAALAYLVHHRQAESGSIENLIEGDVARSAIAALRDSVDLPEACDILECSAEDFVGLALCGLVKSISSHSGAAATFTAYDRYLRLALVSLRRELSAKTAPSSERLTPLRQAADTVGCELHEGLRAILSGRLKSVSRDEGKSLIDGIEVEPAELKEAMGIGKMIGAAAVRKRLSLSQRSLAILVAEGFIGAYMDTTVGTTVFLPRDVDRFDLKYVSSTRLLAENGTATDSVFADMKARGILPEFSEEEAGTAIFRRSAVRSGPRRKEAGDFGIDCEIRGTLHPLYLRGLARRRPLQSVTLLPAFLACKFAPVSTSPGSRHA